MTLSTFFFGQPRYIARTPWRPSWAVLATILIFIAAQFVASSLFPWLEDAQPGQLPLSSTNPTRFDAATIGALMTWLLLTQLAVAGLVLAAASLFGGSPRQVLQLGPIDGGVRSVGYAILAMAALLGAFNIIVYWLWQSDMLADMQLYMAFVRSESWVVAWLAIGLGAPLMEELLFRGFLQSSLAQSRLGFAPAAVVTTAAWAALHWGYSAVGLLEVFLIGLYFSWLLWRTGSLWPALVCHALYNSMLMAVLRHVDPPL